MNIVKNSKLILLLIGLIGILLLTLIIKLITSSSPEPPKISSPLPSPTFIPNNLPSSEPNIQNQTTQIFKDTDLEKNYQRIVNKKALPSTESVSKDKLLAPLQGKSGIIFKSSNFNVEYLKSAQYFMVKLLINDTDKAKNEASDWFNKQGISDEGACNLPVIFYLSSDVSRYLKENSLSFNPTPRGCN